MNENQALDILGQALNIANQKGAFELSTSAAVYSALATLTQMVVEKQNIKEPVKKEVKPKN